jgi:hypothetical protein
MAGPGTQVDIRNDANFQSAFFAGHIF